MKRIGYFLSLVILLTTVSFMRARAQKSADDIVGKWINEDKTRIIEVIKSGDKYNAVIRQAPDQTILGKRQLTDLSYKSGMYYGNVLLPLKGKTYPCSIRLKDDGSMELMVKAGLVRQSHVWTKVT